MNDNLKKSLQDLDAQLNTVQLSDTAKQNHLDEVRQAVKSSLEPGGQAQHVGLRERLEKAAFVFDSEHPGLSSALRSVVDILAEAGF